MYNLAIYTINVVCLVDLASDYEVVKASLDNAIREIGTPYLFFNCAGMALCGTLENHSSSDIMVSNYYYNHKISK